MGEMHLPTTDQDETPADSPDDNHNRGKRTTEGTRD